MPPKSDIPRRMTGLLTSISKTLVMFDFITNRWRYNSHSPNITVSTTWHCVSITFSSVVIIQLMRHLFQCGSCSMKPRENGGVLDDRLNVYGVEGLKVAGMLPTVEGVRNTYTLLLRHEHYSQ
jgi:hypothetical protein